MKDQELEIKYYVADLAAIDARLQSLGAVVEQVRTHELNLRFDTPGAELTNAMQVLRLRHDTADRLTFKGPMQIVDGIRLRQEIEFTVGDFRSARTFLEALGYKVMMIYEKYRAVYQLDGVLVTLDEMPYGDFVEIEGPHPGGIQAVSRKLGLDWDARILGSYAALFSQLCAELGFTFRDLIFENFEGIEVSPAAMSVRPADGSS
jgi:adenylate cyclase class 2